ncbi:phosphoribosylamine--glycine ligase [Anaplasmataceae bacterium AB001_6]|nr:phosphoribosylamine--glycine ligase [Anaplasmataceae bacterium AB001_6]
MKVNKKNKVLVVGEGGREHAIISSIKESDYCEDVYTTNPNFSSFAKLLDFNRDDNSFVDLSYKCKQEQMDLIIIGSENHLAAGMSDVLRSEGLLVFGPSKNATKLESSKSFTKELCSICNIPTAKYGYFTDIANAKKYVDKLKLPVVIKADGLAHGKGVSICETSEEAYQSIEDILNGRFGDEGKTVIVEEFLRGKELSVFVLFDGKEVMILDAVQDYKSITVDGKIYNTGGMGSFSPVKIFTPELKSRIMREIIYPTINSLSEVGINYCGVLFAGIMVTKSGPKLLEYNVRFGDPETQVLLKRLDVDILQLLLYTSLNKLNKIDVSLKNNYAVCIVMATKGYPLNYSTDYEIKGLEEVKKIPGIDIFYAGAYEKDGRCFSKGGRALNIVSVDSSLFLARKKAYKAVKMIDWPEGFYVEKIAVQ